MNKQDLLENYTMEQLADKVIALEITISDMKNKEEIVRQYNKNILTDVVRDFEGKIKKVVNLFEENKKKELQNTEQFFPTKPIMVADMLINTEIELREILEDGKEAVFKPRKFYISELRQIAEHLLVYCNANGEGE